MKKVPLEFIKKIRETIEQECELDSCEDCILFENGLCDNFSGIAHLIEKEIDENNKLMQINNNLVRGD